MASPDAPHYYTPSEEIANSITHGIGAVLSVAGLAVLVGFAAALGGKPLQRGRRHIIGEDVISCGQEISRHAHAHTA